jgi:methylisocitrate lyase
LATHKVTIAQRHQRLADLLAGGGTIVVPGCHDALSALIIAGAGFDVGYIGSYATAAAGLAAPDVGVLGLDDLVSAARRVVNAVDGPVIADAEGGFFEPPNIWRTVQAFEDAGVSAIHIEDHAGGKHTDLPQSLIPLDAMLAKLRAAQDARADAGFQIIARTDAIWATKDFAEARRRVAAFHAAGADLVFPTGATPEMIAALKADIPAKYVVVDGPGHPSFSGRRTAASVVLYYGFSLFAATQGLNAALGSFARDQGADLSPHFEPVGTFEDRLGYKAFTERARRYQSGA